MRCAATHGLILCLLAVLLSGCQSRLKTDPHSERAHDMMMRARAPAGPEGPDYTEDVWLGVIEELSQVSPRYEDYEKEMALMEEIKTMRAAAFLERARQDAEREERERKNREEVKRHVDQILANPFSPGGTGEDPSEGGRWQVVLESAVVNRESGRYRVRGQIQNVSRQTLENPLVIVDFVDRRGGVLGSAQAMIEPSRIPPLGYGSFSVEGREAGVRTWKLRVRELSGEKLSVKISEGTEGNP